jgi:hypothetical protein
MVATKKENRFYFNRVSTITRKDNDIEVPYLIRRTIFAITKWFSIKLHKIILSDDVCTHDHPWPFFTIILKGGYFEWTPLFKPLTNEDDDIGEDLLYENGKILKFRNGSDGEIEVKRWHGPGSILYRPAEFRHQLELAKDEHGNLIPATTFVITGRVVRKWGFFTKTGWKYHKEYDKNRDC